MKSSYLKSIGGAVLGISLLLGIGMVSTTNAQGQWPGGQNRDSRRDQDRDHRRDRNRDDRNRRGDYGNYGSQAARNQGYQDGLQTGASDARRRQSYNPQRSHYYRNATGGYNGGYGNRNGDQQAYRDGFLRGYDEGYRRFGGNRRSNNGRWFPW